MSLVAGIALIITTSLAVAIVAFYVARTIIKDITEAYDGMLEKRKAFTNDLVKENKRLMEKISCLEAECTMCQSIHDYSKLRFEDTL